MKRDGRGGGGEETFVSIAFHRFFISNSIRYDIERAQARDLIVEVVIQSDEGSNAYKVKVNGGADQR